MQYLFDDNLVVSFREVVEKSLIEFFNEQDLTSFRKMPRNGMNSICATIHDIYYAKTNYEIAYRIVVKKKVTVVPAGTRENFYQQLKHYLDTPKNAINSVLSTANPY